MKLGGRHVLVPGPAVPPGVWIGDSNNNLDVAIHDGTLFLAWRTAPTHFASAETRLHVVASDDNGATWRHELTIEMGRDKREPRLVSWQGRLLLYWFTAGTVGTKFEPDRVWVAARAGEHDWTEPVAISPPDCVVWRVRPVGGRLLMTLYRGAGSLFTTHPVPLTVEMWASDDGFDWAPADPDRPVVHEGGAEAEFVELPDGRLVAVVRKEGPEGGWGSDIATAPASAATEWTLSHDPRKFDSPLLFLDRGNPFLIARRQVAFDGRFDHGLTFLSDMVRTKLNWVLYSATPKRTAVYAIDADGRRARWLGDLPSAGDTSFAGEVPLAVPGGHLIFNYSSPVSRGWWPWFVGQLRPTHIYAVEVYLDEGDAG